MEKKTKYILISIAILILGIVIISIFIVAKKNGEVKNYVDFVRTYNVISINASDDAEYVNLIIRDLNSDSLAVVKVARNLIEDEIIEDSPYEFTFDYNGPALEDTVTSIFSNMTLKSVKLTNKLSTEQRQDTL